MTAAQTLLDDLTEIGAAVTMTGSRLLVRAGPQPVPKSLIDQLRNQKDDLAAVLESKSIEGAGGRQANDQTAVTDDGAFEERAALMEDGSGVPREWAEGFAWLDLTNRPTGFTQDRWQRLIDDGGRFLDRWGAEAARLEWQAEDVFGVHPVVPSARHDLMGLVPLIGGGDVVSITADRATIRRGTGAELTVLRQAVDGAVAVWDVVAGASEKD